MFLQKILSFFKVLPRSLFGQWQWTPPRWFKFCFGPVQNFKKSSPQVFRLLGMGIVLLVVSGGVARYWYLHRPQPHFVKVEIAAPDVTPLQEKLVPYNVMFHFSESVAKLEDIGKKVEKGISLAPAAAGFWSWTSDKHLVFVPENDWPAGQKYQVRFARDFFPDHVPLEKLGHEFSTPAFNVAIADFYFYQDPNNPRVKKTITTLRFSHPVNPKELESRIKLVEQEDKDAKLSDRRLQFTVSYDKHHREAYIHSENLVPKTQDSFIKIALASGIRATTGNDATKEDIAQQITIPNLYQFFRIETVTTDIRNNEDGDPEQTLIIQTKDAVKQADLAKHLEVYLLPKKKNSTLPLAGKQSRWTSPGEVDSEILSSAKQVTLKATPTLKEHETLHSFIFKERPGRSLYVRVNKGLKSFGGYEMQNDYDAITRAPKYPVELAFLSRGMMLSLSGEKKLSFVTRSLSELDLKVHRVLPGRINDLILLGEGDFHKPMFYNYSFNEENISEIFTEKRLINNTDPSQAQYGIVDLAKYLGPKKGLFILTLEDWDKNHEYVENDDRRLVLVTDMGIFAKRQADGSREIFVHSLSDGGPVAGVTLSVLAKNGTTVAQEKTDAEGHARFKNLEDLLNEQKPVALIATTEDDMAFLPFERADREIIYSNSDTGGLGLNGKDELQAYAFSDRGIYRPGETLRAGVIIRSTNFDQDINGIPLEVVIKDARELPVFKKKITTPKSGFFAVNFTTDANALTGTYNLNIYLVEDKDKSQYIGSTAFRVEEFLPDQMKISTEFSRPFEKGWFSPEDLNGKVELKNLYGTAAGNRLLKAKIKLSPAYPFFGPYADYTFFNPLKLENAITEDLSEQKTDESGRAEFKLDLTRFAKATYHLNFTAEGFAGEGGRSVVSDSSVLVSPLPFLLGYKSDSELNFLHLRSQHKIELVAIDPALKKIDVSDLKMQIIDKRYISTLVQQNDGSFHYQSVLTEKTLHDEPLAINSTGLDFDLPTGQAGSFEIRIFDKDGGKLCEIPFVVAGQANLTRALDRAAELKMSLNKDEYLPGEEIEINVTAPYTGFGLITLERDKVYAHKWFTASTTATVQTITIPEDFEGNGYVSVAFVRSTKSSEIFMSPLSYNAENFSVNLDHRREEIELDVPALLKPGQELNVSYKTNMPAKIVVFAVDEGILQFAGYPTPDPLAELFRKRALEVRTAQTLDLLMPEYSLLKKLAAAGGDQSYKFVGNNLNPFKRKTEPPVAFWSGILDADENAGQISFPIPESFYGGLRIMAVAVGQKTLGVAERQSTVRGPFVISPNAPLFVAPGDEFEVGVTVANNIDGSSGQNDIVLEANTSQNLELIGEKSAKLTIPKSKESFASFRFRARDELGNAEVFFTAISGKENGRGKTSLSIRPAMPRATSFVSGHFAGGESKVKVPRQLYTDQSKQTAAVSALPLGLAKALVSYLDGFEYDCTEQLVSRAFPALVLSREPEFALSAGVAQNHFNVLFQQLRGRQNADGSFRYWPEFSVTDATDENESSEETADEDIPEDLNATTDMFASLYASHFLTEAHEAGFAVPSDMLERSSEYLQGFLAERRDSNATDANLRSYATYILTRQGTVTANHLVNLRDYLDQNIEGWQQTVTASFLASTYRLLKYEAEAQELIGQYQWRDPSPSGDAEHFFEDDLSVNSQHLWLLAKHFPEKIFQVSAKNILQITDGISQGRFHTLSSAFATLALVSYSKGREVGADSTKMAIFSLSEGKKSRLETSSGIFNEADFAQATQELLFSAQGTGPFFYQVTQSGFDRDLPQTAIAEGLEIHRELRNEKGEVVTEAQVGDDLEVHLQLRSLGESELGNIVVVDLLPGGFDVGDDPVLRRGESIKNTPASWWPDFIDVREDRVIFFGWASPEAKEFVYHIKAVSPGEFVVPPAFAESMYERGKGSRGMGGKFIIRRK